MLQLKTRNFLTGEELSRDELEGLLTLAAELKAQRKTERVSPVLQGKTLALAFEKPSLRTRMSFTVAMHELGGFVVETSSATSKREEPEDMARVLAGYCDAIMLRTHEHSNLTRIAEVSHIPLINGLSDLHHPCQTLADLLTLRESFPDKKDLVLTYIGDGNNILHSLFLLLPYLGMTVRYVCPEGYQPSADLLAQAKKRAELGGGSVESYSSLEAACRGAHAIYTDVWTSMGFEKENAAREKAFTGFQVTEEHLKLGQAGAIFLHCLPMLRGKEVSQTLPDSTYSRIFQQSENRLHAQKALLASLLRKTERK